MRAVLLHVLKQMTEGEVTAAASTAALVEPALPLTAQVVQVGVAALLLEATSAATTSGWAPRDLAEVTRRHCSAGHVPYVVGLLERLAAAHPADRTAPAWRQDLAACGPGRAPVLCTASGLQSAMELAALLLRLPPIAAVVPAPGRADPSDVRRSGHDVKLLARVRALLAKAEATEFAEEAEALSAKAQELVTRHSLDRLLVQGPDVRAEMPVARRLWLDAPYVFAKATLVQAVAEANRCRSAMTEQFGFCTLVGLPGDVTAVELLVASLLVQAHAAMVQLGSHTDRRGMSRTRSFRQSFLMAYAHRIGERLRSASEQVLSSLGRAELVPLVRRSEQRLDAAFQELFPRLTSKPGSVGNACGWAAGTAAADAALLGADTQITATG